MRTTTFTENGREHILCFNPWAQREFLLHYGDIEKVGGMLNEDDAVKMLDEATWMLSTLMQAGDKYAKIMGIENAEPLTPEELLIVCDLDDFVNMRDTIQGTLVEGSKRDVVVEPNTKSKNVKTTPKSAKKA